MHARRLMQSLIAAYTLLLRQASGNETFCSPDIFMQTVKRSSFKAKAAHQKIHNHILPPVCHLPLQVPPSVQWQPAKQTRWLTHKQCQFV